MPKNSVATDSEVKNGAFEALDRQGHTVPPDSRFSRRTPRRPG